MICRSPHYQRLWRQDPRHPSHDLLSARRLRRAGDYEKSRSSAIPDRRRPASDELNLISAIRGPQARGRKGSRRIQPDRARLQLAASAQHCRHGRDAGGCGRMIGARIALFCGNRTLEALPMPCKTPPARFRPETPETRRPARVDVIFHMPDRVFARSARYLQRRF